MVSGQARTTRILPDQRAYLRGRRLGRLARIATVQRSMRWPARLLAWQSIIEATTIVTGNRDNDKRAESLYVLCTLQAG